MPAAPSGTVAGFSAGGWGTLLSAPVASPDKAGTAMTQQAATPSTLVSSPRVTCVLYLRPFMGSPFPVVKSMTGDASLEPPPKHPADGSAMRVRLRLFRAAVRLAVKIRNALMNLSNSGAPVPRAADERRKST